MPDFLSWVFGDSNSSRLILPTEPSLQPQEMSSGPDVAMSGKEAEQKGSQWLTGKSKQSARTAWGPSDHAHHLTGQSQFGLWRPSRVFPLML